jgi:broad specificity phosphatase PhoE
MASPRQPRVASRLLLIRHAAIGEAERSLLVGASDLPASTQGLQDLQRLAGVLASFNPEAWFCSPLLRARQSAARLGEFCEGAQGAVIDDRLREIDFGRWERKSFAEIAAMDRELIADWAEYDGFAFPGGESVAAFRNRIEGVLAELRASVYRETALVAHGGVIRTLICLALGLSPKNYLLFDVRPGCLAVLDLHPDCAVLTGLNL